MCIRDRTYCLHIMVRYELEKRLFDGSLDVHDLPREWNRLYKEMLGLDVPNDREGVLQDSHWSFGAIGYFPRDVYKRQGRSRAIVDGLHLQGRCEQGIR